MSTSPPPPHRRTSVEVGGEQVAAAGPSVRASSPPSAAVSPIACSSPSATAASASLLAANAPALTSGPSTNGDAPPALATAVNEANVAAVARASDAISEVGTIGTNSAPSVSASEPSTTSKATTATSVDDTHSRKDSEPGVTKAPPGTLLTDAVSRVIDEDVNGDRASTPPSNNVRIPEVSNEPTAQPYTANKTPFPMPAGVRILVNAGAQLADSTLPRAVADQEESTGITLGKLRCYWALLSSKPAKASGAKPGPATFLHLDPVLSAHLDDDSPKMIGSTIADFVHPEERTKTLEELVSVQRSETLFGSAIRCRFASLDKMRSILSQSSPSRSNSLDEAMSAAPTAASAKGKMASGDEYQPVDIVVNCVGDGLHLAFFHAVLDESPADADEKNKTSYSNWCGTPPNAFSKRECDKIWQQLQVSQEPRSSQTGPSRVFQVLSNTDRPEILLSWPPPRLFPPDTAPHVLASSHLTPFMDGSYFADDFARLARGIDMEASSGASTSCTRRFRAKHTMTTEGLLRSIESVLVPYGSITLACYHVEFSQSLSRDDIVAPPSVVPAFDRVPSPGPAETRPSLGGHTGRARKSSWAAPGDEVIKRARAKRTRSDQGVTRRTSTSSDDRPSAPTTTTTLPPAPMPFRTPVGSARFGAASLPLASLYSSDTTRSFGSGSSASAGASARSSVAKRERSASGSRTTLPEFSSLDSLASLASVSAPMSSNSGASRGNSSGYHSAPRPSGLPSMAAMGLDSSSSIPDSPSGRNVATLAAVAAAAAAQARRCLSCGTTSSPEWRKGPAGPKTLCNSCGIRESRKRRKAEQEALVARSGGAAPAKAKKEGDQ